MSATPLPSFEFVKVEGLGNDFLVVDAREGTPLAARTETHDEWIEAFQDHAKALCERRFGIGADGILLVLDARSMKHVARMVVINADGSRPEMCGNGLRCVAAHLLPEADTQGVLEIDTDAGPKRCELRRVDHHQCIVRVDMGVARLLGELPLARGEGRSFSEVDIGNPHTIAFVDDDPEGLARTLGPAIEVDPRYPARTNVEFARIEAPDHVTLWVWERGCGITHACGTGACATIAAATHRGLLSADQDVRVDLPGGTLRVRAVPVDADTHAWRMTMTGPATKVYRGRFEP